jgi:hypothetical protein
VDKAFAKSLCWIERQQEAKNLLIDKKSFPDVYITKEEYGEVYYKNINQKIIFFFRLASSHSFVLRQKN